MHFVFKHREKRKGWYSKRNLRDLPEEKAQTRQQERQHFHAAATTGDRAALQTPRSLGGFTEVGREGRGRREGDRLENEKVGRGREGNPLHPDVGEEEEEHSPVSLGKPF